MFGLEYFLIKNRKESIIYVTFATHWFLKPRSGCRMKRESGGNPGQSRCCELQKGSENTESH